MTLKLSRKQAINLTSQEYKQCYSLNFRVDGFMQETLKHKRDHSVVYRIVEDGQLVSWALVFYDSSYSETPTVYFYTRKSCRRKGYGQRLKKRIRKDYTAFHVCSHDSASQNFFSDAPEYGLYI